MCDNEMAMKACRPLPEGTPALAGDELDHLLGHAEGWQIVGGELAKTLEFTDHYQTMAFVNAVAWISHREDHHPEIVVGYNTCTVKYSTHSIGGLSDNDFICAAKVDRLVED
jgi:4a-hydroxytetrahydrobiopterin dehydratase